MVLPVLGHAAPHSEAKLANFLWKFGTVALPEALGNATQVGCRATPRSEAKLANVLQKFRRAAEPCRGAQCHESIHYYRGAAGALHEAFQS